MSFLRVFILILSFCAGFLKSNPFFLPEICDNGVDDDGDGLIDLQDADCGCEQRVFEIPNGSFEERDCCPNATSQDFCIVDWEKATLSTPDYLNDCGWNGWEKFPVPLPLPDGHACIGFRNGRFENRVRAGEKEYIGICISDQPLKQNKTYHFSFYVGFADGNHSPATDIVFYGTADCQHFPAGIDVPDLVCPGTQPHWEELFRVSAAGSNQWVRYAYDLMPAFDVAALAVGPGCSLESAAFDLYYFFDHLKVEETEVVAPLAQVIRGKGVPCSDAFRLVVNGADTLQYQWYWNQVALVGETGPELLVHERPGAYQVRITGEGDCFVTKPYFYQGPVLKNEVEGTICAGQKFDFHGRGIMEPGIYRDTLVTGDGCDSIVQLILKQTFPIRDTLRQQILKGQSVSFFGKSYDTPGIYSASINDGLSCDSLFFLELSIFDIYIPNVFSPNKDGVNDRFTVYGGPEVEQILSLSVFDRWGDLVWEGLEFAPNSPFEGWDGSGVGAGSYVYIARLRLRNGEEVRRFGSVVVIF